jgi:anaerobic selenocysteine-containing dehydrogenase
MCGLVVTVENETISKIRGDDTHALSRGYTCPKGRALGVLHHDDRRLNVPLSRRDSELEETTWPSVLDDLSDRIATSISEHGPESVAMYLASGSAFDTAGRRAAERFLSVLGSHQKYTATTIDTPSKPLLAEIIGGWSGLTPIWDHESSKLLLLFGSNPVVSHGHSNAIPDPVRRFREFQANGSSIWVIDPRRTETATLADHHLQIAPGTDWLVLGWLVRNLLSRHRAASTLSERTSGHEALVGYVADFDDELVTTKSHLSLATLESLCDAVLRAGRVSALTGTGVSMSATANVTEYLLWALHIVTDSSDRPGGMWFNPGYLLQLDERSLPISDGTPESGPKSRPLLPRRFGEYPCAALVPEIEAGNITTLIVVGGNPITALPDTNRTIAALRSLTTLAVIDILPTETTELASHVLPAVDQLERADLTWLLDSFQLAVSAQFTKAVVAPLGERKPVWWMFGQIADRVGFELLPGGTTIDLATDQTFLQSVIARSRDSESLMSSSTLTIHSGAVFGWVTENVLPDGKWRLQAPVIADQLSVHLDRARASTDNRLVLIPSRQLRLMNSQFREIAAPGGSVDDIVIHASPQNVLSLGSPAFATVESSNGSLSARLVADPNLRDDCVTLTHGGRDPNVCTLTDNDQGIDPLSGMVLQSGFEVSLRPAE